MKIKLDKSNELIQTARIWNAACQDVIDYGFSVHDYNKTRLNRATYKDLRKKYPTLPSALHQTARDQASDMPKAYEKYIGWKVTNAQLKFSKNACYLNVQVEQSDPEPIAGDCRVGIDLGINHIAVCSDNTFWKSGPVKAVKARYQYLRSKPFEVIALEDLTNIRNGKKNKKIGKWSFAELRAIVEYKAQTLGKRVVIIDPKYTSQTCSRCGFQHKENRNGKTFKCQSCGFQIDADLNASRNIATFSRSDSSRLSVNQPNVSETFCSGTSHSL